MSTSATTPIMTAETETIPEDVMAIADGVCLRVFNAMHDDDGRLTDSDPAEIIARAILAERRAEHERCAAAAAETPLCELVSMGGEENPKLTWRVACQAQRDAVVSAIRATR